MAATHSNKRQIQQYAFHPSDDESSRDYTDTATDSDVDFEPQTQNDSKRFKSCPIERKPTRRPNPKVTNRNAMLARENRQKKKDLMDKLEFDNNSMVSENKKMKKALKLKDARIKQLEHERNYLKSIIANRTQIMSVFKAVKRSGLPMTSSTLAYVKSEDTTNKNENKTKSVGFSGFSPCSGYESAPSVRSTNGDDGTVLNNQPVSDLINETLNEFLDDEPLISGYDGLFTEPLEIPLLEDDLSVLEHNYNKSETKPSAGICVHICDSRISLEMCSRCSYNADNAWMEEN